MKEKFKIKFKIVFYIYKLSRQEYIYCRNIQSMNWYCYIFHKIKFLSLIFNSYRFLKSIWNNAICHICYSFIRSLSFITFIVLTKNNFSSNLPKFRLLSVNQTNWQTNPFG